MGPGQEPEDRFSHNEADLRLDNDNDFQFLVLTALILFLITFVLNQQDLDTEKIYFQWMNIL